MSIIDRRQPKPRKAAPEPHKPPRPYEVHRAAFTDGSNLNPPAMAVDVQPMAGDYVVRGPNGYRAVDPEDVGHIVYFNDPRKP